MIKKVAEVHALKKAFGISGLYCEEEYVPVTVQEVKDSAQISKEIDTAETVEDLERIKLENPRMTLDINLFKSWKEKKDLLTNKDN